MFAIAILIGIYSYLILALGLLGLLFKPIIISATILFVFFVTFAYRKNVTRSILSKGYSLGKLEKIFLGFIIMLAFVNLIGALGPELGFDALWYHLALPKLYLENHSIYYIPGGLLYYSVMPKLTEMLYTGALALDGEILAKVIHFFFGILSSIVLYKLSRLFFSPKISLVAVVIFYSNLVVGWQSITAYVDLARTFFEIMALWGFVKWWKTGQRKWLMMSTIMLGLAISTKLLAIGSLFIYSVLIAIHYFTSEESKSLLRHHPRWFLFSQPATIRGATNLCIFWFISLLIPLPWFVFSYVNTGNPVYPFFTDLYKVGLNVELLNPFRFIGDVWVVFMQSPDPISPIYIIFTPLVILFFFRHFRDSGQARMTHLKIIAIYSFLAIIIWYFTSRTGGGRFILPYLPAFSILVAGALEKLHPPRRSHGFSFGFAQDQPATIRGVTILNWCISLVIFISSISIVYGAIANAKYIPVIVGTQTKSEFLSANLNFSFGDFYDIDGYFKKNIEETDKVLLYGFHNLYYVEFPFIDSSWVKKGDEFNYVATQNAPSADGLPKRFKDWEIVYLNPKTHVKVYSKGEIKWSY